MVTSVSLQQAWAKRRDMAGAILKTVYDRQSSVRGARNLGRMQSAGSQPARALRHGARLLTWRSRTGSPRSENQLAQACRWQIVNRKSQTRRSPRSLCQRAEDRLGRSMNALAAIEQEAEIYRQTPLSCDFIIRLGVCICWRRYWFGPREISES